MANKARKGKKLRYFCLVDKCYESNLGGYDPDDEWSRDSTSEEHNPIGLVEVRDGDYHDICGVGEGDTFYLVYVIYDTGDSFGQDYGRMCPVSLHSDPKVAQLNKERLEKDNRAGNHNSYSIKLRNDDGSNFTIGKPWSGYFETFNYVEVRELSVMTQNEANAKLERGYW